MSNAQRAASQAPLDERRSDGKRIQFEFAPDAIERLNSMKARTDATSYAELVRNSLRLYEWLLDQTNNGYDIGLIKDDKLVKTIKFMF